DQRDMPLDILPSLAGKDAERAGESIDRAGADDAIPTQFEIACRTFLQLADGLADRRGLRGKAAPLDEIADAEKRKEILLPAILMRQIGPLACQRAARARRRAARLPRQEIGDVEE